MNPPRRSPGPVGPASDPSDLAGGVLTLRQAGAFIAKSKRFVQQLLAAGTIPASASWMHGNCRVVEVSALVAYLAGVKAADRGRTANGRGT